MSNYTIWISTPRGQRLAVLDTFVRLEYRRVVNATGHYRSLAVRNVLPLRLLLQADTLPASLIERDSRLEVWRTLPGSNVQQLDTETTWLVRRVRSLLTADGQRLLELSAVPALDLLASRVVAYAAGSAQATHSGPADDVMKAFVRDNFSTLASDSARELSDWLNIAPDLGQAPTVSKSGAWRTVLDVLHELAEASAEAGTALFFDIVSPAPGRLEFRTYTGTRGIDNSFAGGRSPVVLSPETGSLTDVERTFDYEDEYTVVYAAGQGAESERWQVQVSAADLLRGSPFARRERFVDARQAGSLAALTAEAQAALSAGRPRSSFEAGITSTPGMVYGQHWHWGDRVTVVFAGERIACHIDEVMVEVEAGRETVRARLRAVDTAPVNSQSLASAATTVETEVTYQQVQRVSLPAATRLALPAEAHLLAYGRYRIEGTLQLGAGARIIILT